MTEDFLSKVEIELTNRLSQSEMTLRAGGASVANPLSEGLNYAVFGGGKRIRPTAVYLAAESVRGCSPDTLDALVKYACAVELVHSYSLVHDDLPAMDNDDYRRGKLSVHKKFGEGNGILLGDALLTEAMKVLAEGSVSYGKIFAECAVLLSDCAMAMAAGQYYDLKSAGNMGADYFERTDLLKTGALFKAAFVGGVMLGGGGEEDVKNMCIYAEAFGLVFQYTDDLLDEGKDNSIVNSVGRAETQKRIVLQAEKAAAVANKLANPQPLTDVLKAVLNRKN